MFNLPQVGFYSVVTKDKIYIASALDATEDKPDQDDSRIIVVQKNNGIVSKIINIPGKDVQCLAWDNDKYIYTASNTNGSLVRINIINDNIDREYSIPINRAFDILIDTMKAVAYISTQGINTLYIVSLNDKEILNRYTIGEGIMSSQIKDNKTTTVWINSFKDSYIVAINN